jgi:hypothetical protein
MILAMRRTVLLARFCVCLAAAGGCAVPAYAGARSSQIGVSLVVEDRCTANTDGVVPTIGCDRVDSSYLVRVMQPGTAMPSMPADGLRKSRPAVEDRYIEIFF